MRNLILLIGLLLPGLFPVALLHAQSVQVSGRILSKEDDQPLPGVNVVVKGTTHGVSTAVDGTYTIRAERRDILVFSCIGFRQQEFPVGDRIEINMVMEPYSATLDELVVVGYGSKKKGDLVGAVSSVKSTELVGMPSADLQGMLKGQVAGLAVSVGSAAPGGSSNVLLRGVNSLKGGTQPLYVVDGFPIDNVNEINVNDIETVSVLKDASAQAIYGARASNGVILITTRRGVNSKGRINVSYDGYLTFQNVSSQLKLFSPDDYIQVRREAFRGDNASAANNWVGKYLPDETIFTPTELANIKAGNFVDWLDLAFNENAVLTKHDVSIAGGNDQTKYSASLGVFYQDGIRLSSDYRRYNGKIVLDQRVSNWLTVGASAYYSHYFQNRETTTMTEFITFSPIARVYDNNGNLNLYPLGDYKSVNPLWWATTRSSTYNGDRGIYNGYLDVTPVFFPGFKYRLTGSYDNSYREAGDFRSLSDPSNYLGKGYVNVTYQKIWNYNLENILTYEGKAFRKHRYDVTLMQSIYGRNETTTSSLANELGNDFFGVNSLGSALEAGVGRTVSERSMVSFMGRINYIINDRYLFNFTIRADGSSVFGANNKWGYFPSFAVSWNMHKENFIPKDSWITESKLRFSMGQIGNEGIPPYGSLSLATSSFYVSNGTPVIGYLPGTTLPNPNLKWETTTTWNLGYDFAYFKGRLTGTLELYRKITNDLLVNRLIPTSLGYSSIPDNLGEIRNSGTEISLSGFPVSNNNISWMVGLRYARNRNELTKGVLTDPKTGEYIDDVANRWFIGEPVNVYYDYKFDGIWQISDDMANSAQPNARPGDVRVANINGDSIISPDDRVIMHRDPDFIVSVNTAVKFRGFEFSADVYWVSGGMRSNPFMYDVNYGGSLQGYKNGIYRDYWLPETGGNEVFRPHETVTSEYRGALGYQDYSYVRLTNVTLAYTFPAKWTRSMGMSRFRVYIRGDRLLTFTRYQSFSPETNPDDYPETKDVTIGLNINF